ncbi:hypothetical protein Tco_1080624 [Tanacetum coccineum]|uniref:Uncharacterized protein n=1 Tax=Tanacetum coccineum TaxID=301880 RepID=A0ABQ5HVG5_9ASTR
MLSILFLISSLNIGGTTTLSPSSSSSRSQMTDKYFAEYIGIEVKKFRETLLQHMSNIQKQDSKVDLGKELDVGLVVMERNGTKSEVQDESSRSGKDTDVDDANIRPIYDEKPTAEV